MQFLMICGTVKCGLALGLLLGGGAVAHGARDPLACLEGRWSGVRAETLPTGSSGAGRATQLQLRARQTVLEIRGRQLRLEPGGPAVSFTPAATSENRVWVRLAEPLPGGGDLALFEFIDPITLRAGLLADEPFVFSRMSALRHGLAPDDCMVPPPEANRASALLGQWRFRGWMTETGAPAELPEVWISGFPGANVVFDRERVQITARGDSVEAPYRLADPGDGTLILTTEAPLAEGRFGRPSTLSVTATQDELRVESLIRPGHFALLERVGDPPAAAEVPARRRAPMRHLPPFPVPYTVSCEPGTKVRGAAPPEGHEQWCERIDSAGPVRQGWYIAWHPNAIKAVAGRYADGREEGVWMRWDDHGRPRVRAEFRAGVQDGLLLRWDELGVESQAVRYRGGAPEQP